MAIIHEAELHPMLPLDGEISEMVQTTKALIMPFRSKIWNQMPQPPSINLIFLERPPYCSLSEANSTGTPTTNTNEESSKAFAAINAREFMRNVAAEQML